MNDEMPQEQMSLPEVPKKKRTLSSIVLIVFGVILATSCLVCGVLGYLAGRPGKPIPATAFIDEETTGIVVLRADVKDPELKSLMSFASASALEHNVLPEHGEMLEFAKKDRAGQIPSVTLIGSYKGDKPEDLSSFGVVVLRELPWFYRWMADRGYDVFTLALPVETFQGAKIVSAEKLMESARKEAEEKGKSGPSLPSLGKSHVTLFESCLFIGRSVEDVQAGVEALQAPEPAPEEGLPFMELYEHADSGALLFGVLSNRNEIFLAALYPDPDAREDAREWLEPKLTLDPRQIRSIVFSIDLVPTAEAEGEEAEAEEGAVEEPEEETADDADDDAVCDQAVIRLWVEGANPDTAQQIAVAVKALVDSKLNTTEEIPLEFVIDEELTSTEGAVYEGVIRVSGIKAFIEQYFAQLGAEREQLEEPNDEQKEAQEAEQPAQEPEAEMEEQVVE